VFDAWRLHAKYMCKKNDEKNTIFFSNENIFGKMGELFAHFDNISELSLIHHL